MQHGASRPTVTCLQAKDQLSACVERRNKYKNPARAAPLGPKMPKASAGPPRKSTRLEGRPAPIYNEAVLEKADGAERKTRARLPEHHGKLIALKLFFDVSSLSLFVGCPWA